MKELVVAAIFVLGAGALAPPVWSSKVGIPRSADCAMSPVAMPDRAGPMTLKLSFTPTEECDHVTVTITKLWNIEYAGDTVWTVEVEKGKQYESALSVVIPPDDTCGMELNVKCGRIPNRLYAYFVTTGDTVLFQRGNPRYNRRPTPSAHENTDPDFDTMSVEQLQTEHRVLLDLREPAHMRFAEKLLGPLPDSCRYQHYSGVYVLNVSLENLIKLGKEGIEGDFVTPPPWDRRYNKSKDSPRHRPRKPDSLREQGALDRDGDTRSPPHNKIALQSHQPIPPICRERFADNSPFSLNHSSLCAT